MGLFRDVARWKAVSNRSLSLSLSFSLARPLFDNHCDRGSGLGYVSISRLPTCSQATTGWFCLRLLSIFSSVTLRVFLFDDFRRFEEQSCSENYSRDLEINTTAAYVRRGLGLWSYSWDVPKQASGEEMILLNKRSSVVVLASSSTTDRAVTSEKCIYNNWMSDS